MYEIEGLLAPTTSCRLGLIDHHGRMLKLEFVTNTKQRGLPTDLVNMSQYLVDLNSNAVLKNTFANTDVFGEQLLTQTIRSFGKDLGTRMLIDEEF